VFHIGFFMAAGYVSAGSVAKQALVTGAAVYHETLQPQVFKQGGNSRNDYVASMYGALAGDRMIQVRDRGDGDVIPAMVEGLYGKDGHPLTTKDIAPDRVAVAQTESDAIRAQRHSLLHRAAIDYQPHVNALIGGVKAAQWLGIAGGRRLD
jgi:hypothetical protein